MGAFDANRKDIITIRAPWWDKHESCEARTIVRSGDEEWVLNQQMIIQPKGGNRKQRRASGFQKQDNAGVDIKSQLGAVNRLWVQKMLESWTFTMGGQPMPFAKSGQNEVDDKRMGRVMQLLDQTYVDYIYEQIMAAQPKQVQDQVLEEEDDEEDDDEEGSLFFDNASTSIVGKTDEDDLDQRLLLQEMMSPTTAGNRNFLSRS